MIQSLLDNDLYKFSMGYAYMKLFPNVVGEFVFNDRNNTEYDAATVARIKMAMFDLEKVSMSPDMKEWAIEKMPYIPAFYWEWLSGFRFESDKIDLWVDEQRHLHISVTDLMYKATLYEVPILAIVSEACNHHNKLDKQEVMSRLEAKVMLSNTNNLLFSEFGTRRRFSYEVQDMVVEYLKDYAAYCVGTSNVHLAWKYDMKPIGTVAHEWIMMHGALYGYRNANFEAYENWVRTYDGDLGIALTDTWGLDAFLNNFTLKQAKLFDGVRQDSGDEYEFVDKVVAFYKSYGIDPTTKTIVFSNALDFPKYKEIAEYCSGKIMCSAGIGTNLTNDTGYKPMNIVMKLNRCQFRGWKWNYCVKISDDKGKMMGLPEELEVAMKELDIKQ